MLVSKCETKIKKNLIENAIDDFLSFQAAHAGTHDLVDE